ncbi:hypothetical protein [Anaerocolumna jejuensis]|uniref:hypothetical protein n=1 Tax=Anaerocolumna jejuensis TaxID=259063 RepID=UPI003F7C4DFB
MGTKYWNVVKKIYAKQLLKSGGKLGVIIYFILNLFVAIAMIISLMQGDGKHIVACFKIFIMFLIPWIIEWKFKLEISPVFIALIQIFMYAAIILGELDSYYMKYPYWDTMLHMINGFLCASVGFMLVNLVAEHAQSNKVWFKPIYTVLFAFCLSMTVGVLWEFYEFGMDTLCNRDMQKDTIIHTIKSVKLDQETYSLTILEGITDVSINGDKYNLGGYLDIGLYDTMGDLFDNLVGTLVFSIIGYYTTKKECRYKTIKCFLYIQIQT